ncbi:hypothetical protein FB451DRAFT_1243746, partial [Mycena latifolia]
MPHLIIYIDILPRGVADPYHEIPPEPWTEAPNIIHVSRHPRRLACIDPTVSFISRSPILAESQFTVWTDHAVHMEANVPVTSVIDTRLPDSACFLHRTALIPGYWETIVESPDPTLYTIFHDVIRVNDHRVIFSATYCFRYWAQQHSTTSGVPKCS